MTSRKIKSTFVAYDNDGNIAAEFRTRKEALEFAQGENAKQAVLSNATKLWVREHYPETRNAGQMLAGLCNALEG